MSTDREREALARLIYDQREGPVANQDFGRQSALWAQCQDHADELIAAGWMPRPEPGSADAVLSAIRAAAETLAADEDRLRRLRVFSDYWPTIEAYTPPPDVEDDVSEIVRAMVALAGATRAALGTGDKTGPEARDGR